jgi:ferric-dicitrate binding protein FerR (iron transport regulator)
MPASLPKFDKATVNALRKGQEPALERILRDGYAALVEEAAKNLGDAAFAPRIAVTSVLQVWDERARLEEPEELDKALHDAVRGGVIREQRKRAAGHQAQPGAVAPPPAPRNVDEAWKEVVAGMHAPKPEKKAAAPAEFSAKRHQLASDMAEVGKPPSYKIPIITLLIIVVAVLGALWFANRGGAVGAVTHYLQSPDAKALASSTGTRANVVLSDETKVTLGSESKVTVPPTFNDKYRAVKLEGSATFTVAGSTPEKPFEVRAKDVSVVVQGPAAAFSIRNFAEDDVVVVKVRDGSVAVSALNVKTEVPARTLAAGKAVAVSVMDGSMKEPTSDELDVALGWTDGKIVIIDRPLRAALEVLRRWYGMTVFPKDTALMSRPVSLTAGLESSKDAIAALEKGGNLKYTFEGQQPVLKDASAAPAAKPKGKK